jgi:hypothetical protein
MCGIVEFGILPQPLGQSRTVCTLGFSCSQFAFRRFGESLQTTIHRLEGNAMTTYRLLANQIIDKQCITLEEIDQLCTFVYRDHNPSLDDVRELTNIYVSLKKPNDTFDKFFFGALKQIILADGQIQPAEEFYLLKLLYSDRQVRRNSTRCVPKRFK